MSFFNGEISNVGIRLIDCEIKKKENEIKNLVLMKHNAQSICKHDYVSIANDTLTQICKICGNIIYPNKLVGGI